ncbi:hypothetical protein E0Z10_g5583 [Xylaria hypoxylon]|uniref:Uncharacterized protein n=1 Tax=Xylaria hypoxylon TaxID=37992 RepID=A0A4Z0YUU7_9PEZI|nr:hypothetical protein E0Z10_g5583 [Xylaria hypoxylon]
MSNGSGWYKDADRTYYADQHGRPMVVKAKGYQYHSPEMNIPTYPEVLDGRYKSSSAAPTAIRLVGSEHSGRGHVDHPASKPSVLGVSRPGISTDVYRDAKAQFAAAGPSTSAYDRDYHDYKARGQLDAATGKSYTSWKSSSYVQPTQEEKRYHPDAWGGRPLQTQEWHQEGSRRASDAARAAQA